MVEQLIFGNLPGQTAGGKTLATTPNVARNHQLAQAMQLATVGHLRSNYQMSNPPTADELAGRPRRLRHYQTANGTILAQAIPAGFDSQCRPTAFNQVFYIEKTETLSQAGRLIELWCSDDWLTPWQLRTQSEIPSTLSQQLPRVGQQVSRASVWQFLHNGERYGLFVVLLTAIANWLEHQGPPVVLATANTDDASQWIAAVSYFLTPRQAPNWVGPPLRIMKASQRP
jgi:hypothetical protein